jgi:hypothetical protein
MSYGNSFSMSVRTRPRPSRKKEIMVNKSFEETTIKLSTDEVSQILQSNLNTEDNINDVDQRSGGIWNTIKTFILRIFRIS